MSMVSVVEGEAVERKERRSGSSVWACSMMKGDDCDCDCDCDCF